MKRSVEMTQNASEVGAKPTLRSSKALRGIASREVPKIKKKPWRKKDYRLGAEFQRVTRRTFSHIEGQGGENGRVAKAVTREPVNRRTFSDIEGQGGENGRVAEDVTEEPVNRRTCSNIEAQGGEDGRVAEAVTRELIERSAEGVVSTTSHGRDSAQAFHVEQRRRNPKRDGAVRAIGEGDVELGEVQKSLVPESRGKDVSSLQERKRRGKPISTSSKLVNQLYEKKATGGKSKMIRQVGHFVGKNRSLSSDEGAELGLVQSERFVRQASLLDNSVDLAPELSEVSVPNRDGNVHKASDDVGKRKLPQDLPAQDSVSMEVPCKSDVKQLSLEKGVTGDTGQSNHIQGGAETLNGASEVTQAASEVGGHLSSQFSEPLDGIASREAPPLRKKRKRMKDYRIGVEFQRVTRGKAVSTIEGQSGKNDGVSVAVTREHVGTSAEGVVSKADDGTHFTLVEATEVEKEDLKQEEKLPDVLNLVDKCATVSLSVALRNETKESLYLNPEEKSLRAGDGSELLADSPQPCPMDKGRSGGNGDAAGIAIDEEEGVEMIGFPNSVVPESRGNGVSGLQEWKRCEQSTATASTLVNHLEEKKAAEVELNMNSQNGGAADNLQSNHVEGRAKTMTASQVRIERILRSSEGRRASGEVRLERKRRKKDYRLGVEFLRVTRRKAISNIEGQGCKDGRVTEAVTREHFDGSAEGVLSTVDNGMDSALLEKTDVQQEDRKQGEKFSDVPRLLEKCSPASLSVAVRNGAKESLDLNPVEHACMAAKASEELADSAQVFHMDLERFDPKGDTAVMALEEEEDVEALGVEKSLVTVSRGKDVCNSQEVEKRQDPTSNSFSLLTPFEDKESLVPTPKVISAVGHFVENDVSLSSVESVDEGVIQSKGFVRQASLSDKAPELALGASQVIVPIADGNGQNPSNDQGKQKLHQGLPNLSVENGVAEDIVQSTFVGGGTTKLNDALEVSQNASLVEADLSLRFAGALGGIPSGEVPATGRRGRTKKDYRLGVEFQRVTRRKIRSSVEGQGGKYSRVAEAVTREHVGPSAEEAVFTSESCRDFPPKETDVEQEDPKQEEKSSDVPRVLDKCSTASVPKESLALNPVQNAGMPAKISEELADACQTFHSDQRESVPKSDAALISIGEEENVEMMEVQNSLVPEARGEDVCALQEEKRRGRPTSSPSAPINLLNEKKTAGGKSEMICEVGHVVENDQCLTSGERVEPAVVQFKSFAGQTSLLDNSVDSSLEVPEVSVPNRDGNVQKAFDDEGKQKPCQGFPAHDSTSVEVPRKCDVTQLSLEKGMTGDTVQSNLVEGRAETLNGALEVIQTASEVGGDLTLQFSGALGGVVSREVPPEKKKPKRKKIYHLGADFQRVTRGKAVSTIEGQSSKSNRATEAETREPCDITAEGVLSTAGNARASAQASQVDQRRSDSKGDAAAAVPVEEEENVEMLEAQKSPVPESAGKGVFALQEGESCEELSSNLSLLNHLAGRKPPAQETLSGQHHGEPVGSMESLFPDVQKNDLLSKGSVSRIGPFAVDEGADRKLPCGQQKASRTISSRWKRDVSRSHYLDKICAVDLNEFLAAHKAGSISVLDKSESVTVVETFEPVATLVKSVPVASVIENDTVTAVAESDFVTSIVESGPAASRVESDPAASMVESDAVALIVEERPVATEVESTIFESDPITIAEGSEPVITPGNSSAAIPKSITSEATLETITAVGKPECECVTAVGDESTCVSIADNAPSVATVENPSLPVAVVNLEVCEIDSVRESTARSTEDKSCGEMSLMTEATNSQQEHVALAVPLEDFALKDDDSTKSPLLELASPAEDLVEPIMSNGDESCIKLEKREMHQGNSTAQTPGGQLTQARCLQHCGVSSGKLGVRNGSDEETSSQERSPSATPSPQALFEELLIAEDNDCTNACEGFSRLHKTLEREDSEQISDCEAGGGVQQGDHAFAEHSVRQPVLDVDGFSQDSRVPSVPSTSRQRRASIEQMPPESSPLELTDKKCTVESSDLRGLEQSLANRTPHDGSRDTLESHLDVSTVQVMAVCSPKSIALAMSRKEVEDDSPISVVEYVLADKGPHREKLSSVLETFHESESESQMSDESMRKARDVREVTEVNPKVQEVSIEASDIRTEATHLHSIGETVAEVEVNAEPKAMDFNVEEVNLVTEMAQDVQQNQAKVDEVQVEVLKTQVEVRMVDEADDSLKGDVKFVNVGTKGKRSDTRAEEIHSQLEVHNDAQEMGLEEDGDAEVQDPVAEKVTKTDVHDKESVEGLDNLETAASSQHPLASKNLLRSCNSSVSDGVLVLSVPEGDVSRPFGILFPQLAQAVDELTHPDSVLLHVEKDIQLSEAISVDGVQLGQLTSPVEMGRCLEGDVLQPEELSDVPIEVDEKEDSKNQPTRTGDPVSQRNAVKGSLVSRKRKGRVGGETLNIVGHEGGDRVSSQKKGYLLPSTAIESGGRRIRPRPLDPDQSIPILVEGHDKDFYEYDGGAFYRWVQQQEEANFKRPALEPAADGVGEGGGSTTVAHPVKRSIFIPLFRKLPDDQQLNSEIATRPEHGVVLSSSLRPEAYLRHTKSAARTLGNALGCSYSTVPPVYDMDDEDEEWLRGYNEILEQSGQDQRLSEDTFEEIIELFEREFYRISQTNNNPAAVARNLGNKGVALGHRGKRSDADSSQRHSRMEAKSSKSVELFEGLSSPKGIEQLFSLQNGSEYCCICNGGENSDSNATFVCQICSVKVHQSCYGILGTDGNDFGHAAESANWCCRKCEAVVGGRALPSISCAICCKSGGAMKPTVDPSKWAHVACALYTNETFFVDTDSMEPVDGLATVEARVKKQPLRCGLCGAREGSCVRCSTRGCRAPFHISCGLSQGAAFEFRQQKDLVVGVRSICPRHASFVPGAGDPTEVLPTVSTESSDTLEIRHAEHTTVGKKGNGTEGATMNGAACQGSIPNEADLIQSEGKTYMRKKRTGARPRVSRSNPDASSRPHKSFEKDMHGGTRTSPRSGSMLKESRECVPQYIDETDPYLLQTVEERLEFETVSAATSGSPSHLAVALDNVDRSRKVTTIGDEVDLVTSVAKDKSVPGDPGTSSQAGKAASDAVSLELPSLETLDTNLATPQIVEAVYSFWQSKRMKAKGPILHELRQLQAARSQGIFNKVVQRSSELLPPVGHDSPTRIPVTRRPRSLVTRDPVASRFSEVRQQFEMLRSIAGTVVHREQLKLKIQRLNYECAQQRLLIARETPKSRRCHWCETTNNLLSCSSCPRAFCFQCFKRTRGYGVKGWIAASKQEHYVCSFCSPSAAPERSWPELGTNLPEPRGTPVSRVALVPGRSGDWNHGLEVRTKSNSGKQVSFLNETTWKGDPPSNPYGGSSSTVAPGSGNMIHDGQSADGAAACTEFAVPSTTARSRPVNRADHDEVLSSGPNDPNGEESRVQADVPHEEDGKKVKTRKLKILKKQPETVLRTTKRVKKLTRSPSFVYGSEDETTVSESDESRTDKKTVKLSDLRDKGSKSQCTNLLEAGAEANNKQKGHPPLKCIKFPSGKLILRRHGTD